MAEIVTYAGLFASAFLAATILPAQSEAGLAYLVLSGDYPVIFLLFFASLGNVAGSVVNWCFGWQLDRFKDKRWFPVKSGAVDRAKIYYARFGIWSLLLSWVPIIGDPITVIAGFFRVPLLVFLLVVGVAKTARYIVVVAIALQMI